MGNLKIATTCVDIRKVTDVTPDGTEHRQRGLIADTQRQLNTVFLFFMNPTLDETTKRLSGTKLMAWIVVFFDCFDIVKSHELAELRITKVTDAIDQHNVELFALAFCIWFGKAGMTWAVDLVKAWKGFKEEAT